MAELEAWITKRLTEYWRTIIDAEDRKIIDGSDGRSNGPPLGILNSSVIKIVKCKDG